MNSPVVLKISFNYLKLSPNAGGGGSVKKDSNRVHRSLDISRLSVAVNFLNASQSKKEPENSQKYNEADSNAHQQHQLEKDYQSLCSENSYFLFPLNIRMDIQTPGKKNVENVEPTIDFSLDEPIILNINNPLTRYFTSLNQHVTIMKVVKDNLQHICSMLPYLPKLNITQFLARLQEKAKEDDDMERSLLEKEKYNKVSDYIKLYKRKQKLVSYQPSSI